VGSLDILLRFFLLPICTQGQGQTPFCLFLPTAYNFCFTSVLLEKRLFSFFQSSAGTAYRWGSQVKNFLVSKIVVVLCAKIIGIGRFLTELFQQQKGGCFLRHRV